MRKLRRKLILAVMLSALGAQPARAVLDCQPVYYAAPVPMGAEAGVLDLKPVAYGVDGCPSPSGCRECSAGTLGIRFNDGTWLAAWHVATMDGYETAATFPTKKITNPPLEAFPHCNGGLTPSGILDLGRTCVTDQADDAAVVCPVAGSSATRPAVVGIGVPSIYAAVIVPVGTPLLFHGGSSCLQYGSVTSVQQSFVGAGGVLYHKVVVMQLSKSGPGDSGALVTNAGPAHVPITTVLGGIPGTGITYGVQVNHLLNVLHKSLGGANFIAPPKFFPPQVNGTCSNPYTKPGPGGTCVNLYSSTEFVDDTGTFDENGNDPEFPSEPHGPMPKGAATPLPSRIQAGVNKANDLMDQPGFEKHMLAALHDSGIELSSYGAEARNGRVVINVLTPTKLTPEIRQKFSTRVRGLGGKYAIELHHQTKPKWELY